ncbi:MAG TPA: hypothetical protein PLL66_06985 [Bacteroidales bacterium]|nr:hypothetical protein [Bacteroidales bacterium]
MKKLIITGSIILFLGTSAIFANEMNPGNNNNLTAGTVKALYFPYSTNIKVDMELVYTKGKYSLWRCKDEYVDKYPGNELTGKNFKYFVYKNNSYHLSIRENNKQDIFKYFSDIDAEKLFI